MMAVVVIMIGGLGGGGFFKAGIEEGEGYQEEAYEEVKDSAAEGAEDG
jgi:hypothetical protein